MPTTKTINTHFSCIDYNIARTETNKKEYMNSPFSSRYILSLALADLLLIVTCIPFTSLVYTVEYWPWGVAVCKLSETTKNISVGVSVFTLTALSGERYCAIANPLRRLQVRTVCSTYFFNTSRSLCFAELVLLTSKIVKRRVF